MKILDKVCGKIGLKDADDYEPDESVKNNMNERNDGTKTAGNASSPNVVNFHSSGASNERVVAQHPMKVIVIEPASFNDAQQVADHLKNKKPVIVNFENTDTESARRIIDFISGTTYALSGEIKKVGKNVFLCAPSNVNVTYTQEKGASSQETPWEKNRS